MNHGEKAHFHVIFIHVLYLDLKKMMPHLNKKKLLYMRGISMSGRRVLLRIYLFHPFPKDLRASFITPGEAWKSSEITLISRLQKSAPLKKIPFGRDS